MNRVRFPGPDFSEPTAYNGSPREGGPRGRDTVKLATQPTDTVAVVIAVPDGADLVVDTNDRKAGNRNALFFEPGEVTARWDIAQTVYVVSGQDDDTDDDIDVIGHLAIGGGYDGVSADLEYRTVRPRHHSTDPDPGAV